jgi:hypothetical protein
MNKDEALKLALEALDSMRIVDFSVENLLGWNKAITAIKQALAAQQEHEPENEPFVSLASVQEPVGTYGEIFESMLSLLRTGLQRDQQIYMEMKDKPLYTTPPAQPAVPDAFGTREGEHPQYIQGWNDCRQAMLEMMK